MKEGDQSETSTKVKYLMQEKEETPGVVKTASIVSFDL